MNFYLSIISNKMKYKCIYLTMVSGLRGEQLCYRPIHKKKFQKKSCKFCKEDG